MVKVFAGVIGAWILAATPVFAHATLVQSNPAANGTVAAPKTITLTFSEKIVSGFSGVALSMGDGMGLTAKTSVSDDGKTLTVRPTGPFMAGKWTLSWHAASADDGHKSEGSYSFTIK